jgi:antitoxin CptB
VEAQEDRLKRLRMRSWRRGTREMDLVLGPFADAHLAELGKAGLGKAELALYDRLLDESDQDLLPMVLGQRPAPEGLQALTDRIARFAKTRLRG